MKIDQLRRRLAATLAVKRQKNLTWSSSRHCWAEKVAISLYALRDTRTSINKHFSFDNAAAEADFSRTASECAEFLADGSAGARGVLPTGRQRRCCLIKSARLIVANCKQKATEETENDLWNVLSLMSVLINGGEPGGA